MRVSSSSSLRASGAFIFLVVSVWMCSNFLRRTLTTGMADNLIGLDFEVFGVVQGVFFRKHTEEEANKLGLKGWCMNTPEGSVKGQLEGSKSNIEKMKHWLQFTGSPMSRIDSAKFSNERDINSYTFDSFGIKRKHK